MTGLRAGQLAELVGRVREIVETELEQPAVARPHVLPLFADVVAVLFGLRHNMPEDVVGEVFGCSQATITRYHDVLRPILRWVTGPEADEQYQRAQREGVLVAGQIVFADPGARPSQEATQRRPDRPAEVLQLLPQPATRRGRASHRAPEELEDPQDRLPPDHERLPRRVTHRHRLGGLQAGPAKSISIS
jgi:hypothetical protein